MSPGSAPETLLREITRLLRPLEALGDPNGIVSLLQDLGWDFPGSAFPQSFPLFDSGLTDLTDALYDLERASTDAEAIEGAKELLDGVKGLIEDVGQLPSGFQQALGGTDFWDDSDIDDELAGRLIDHLVGAYVSDLPSAVESIAQLLGVFEWVHLDEEYDKFQLETVLPKVHWDRIPLLVSDPLELANRAYAWETDFESERFLTRVFFVLGSFGFLGGRFEQPQKVRTALGRPAGQDTELKIPLLQQRSGTSLVEGGVRLSGAPATGTKKEGFAVFPYLTGGAGASVDLGSGLKVEVGASLALDNVVALTLRPPAELAVEANLLGTPSVPAAGAVRARLSSTTPPDEPLRLLGEPGKTRVTLAGLGLGLTFEKDAASEALAVQLHVADLAVAVVPGDGDGFLQKVLPTEGITAALTFGLGLSTIKGLHFEGASGLEVTIPIHKSVGNVVLVDSIFARVGVDGRDVESMIGASAAVSLGPVAAAVERMGLKLILSTPEDARGGLGPLDAKLAFKPPDGAGLAVAGGPVKGGGYLFFDPDNEQYAGVLQLEFKAISLTAVGLLTTRMPDGSKGFSLLIIITAEFASIQLGFGFTLNGVGGLIGVNRSVVREVLQAGLKTGALGSILFPKNPVENAPQLLSDLRTVFPPASNSFVFGPMAKLGWGTPTLLTLDLGIILQFPSPLRLFILGRLSMALPARDAAILSVNLEVLGIIDFDEGEASIDARLFDSRLVNFVLTGEMAARLGWAKTPHFELAAGGFNRRFQPPAKFPSLERLALSLAAGDNPRLRLECYFALTSNTLQFGARLDFHVHVDLWILGIFSVDAHLSFDVLIRFVPFQIEADIAAGIDLKRNGKSFLGVWLDLHLKGPGPWHAWGQASFEFLGRHSIGLDITIGPAAPPAELPESRPIELLLAALADHGNWSAQLPAEGQALVTLRELEPAKGEVLVHPLGELSVRQRLVPLKLEIQKFGETRPVGPRRFEITAVTLGGVAADDRADGVREYLAAAQFFQLSDDEKLSRPGFEAFEVGKRIGTSGVDHPTAAETTFGYEDIVIDVDPNTGLKQRRPGKPKTYKPTDALLEALAATGSMDTFAADGYDIALEEPVYVVVEGDGLKVSSAVGVTAEDKFTYTEAAEERQRHLAKAPADADRTQVVGAHEAVST